MKFFTEDGKYVGSIPDREFEESKNSVMPMRLHLNLAKQPKVILASSGYRLMFYSCLVGVLSALLTELELYKLMERLHVDPAAVPESAAQPEA